MSVCKSASESAAVAVRARDAGLVHAEHAASYDARADASISLSALVRILRRRRWILIGTLCAVIGCTLAALMLIPRTYYASATVMLDQRKNVVEEVNAVLTGLPTDVTSVQNQIQVLSSRELSTQVAKTLRLYTDPEFNSALRTPGWLDMWGFFTPVDEAVRRAGKAVGDVLSKSESDASAERQDAVIDRLLAQVSAEPIGMSSTISVTVGSPDPVKAARIANAIVDAYVAEQLEAKRLATERAASWLTDRVKELADEVQNAEAKLQSYKVEHGITITVGGGSIIDQQLVNVNGQLIGAKAELAQKEALHKRVIELQRAGRAADVAQVVASPLVTQLRNQFADLTGQEAQLSTRYLPGHPKIREIQSQQQEMRKKIDAEVARVVESLASDAAVARASVASLQESLDHLESKLRAQNAASTRLKELESAASSIRSIYEASLSRLKETQGQERMLAPDSRVLSHAAIPKSAVPNAALVLGLAGPAGLILALFFVFLTERLSGGIGDVEFAAPVVAILPEVQQGAWSGQRRAANLVVRQPASIFSEAIRGLTVNLAHITRSDAANVLVITSSLPGEGKTLTAISLARSAVRHGTKILIVDADWRSPSIARLMRVKPRVELGEVLSGSREPSSAIVEDACGVHVLASKRRMADPSDPQLAVQLKALLERMRSSYDFIVVDSPPVASAHDALLLSTLADQVLFLVRWGKTPDAVVRRSLAALQDHGARIGGIILNRIPRWATEHDLGVTAARFPRV